VTAIEGVGTYVPRATIDAETVGEAWDGFRAHGIEQKRVAGADEDAVTMAVEAAKAALSDAERSRSAVETLAVGTTTPPVDEGEVGATVAEVLGLSRETETLVHTGSTRAGTRALVAGVRADGPALVVAADSPLAPPDDALDHAAGAGAVALLLGGDGAASVVETASFSREFPGTRFRRRGGDGVEGYGATAYDREAYTTLVSGAVDGLAEAPDALAPTAPDGGLPARAGRAVGAKTYHMADSLGDTGAASPLFGLVAAWADGADSIAVVGTGDGADAVAVEGRLPVATDWPGEPVTYAEYLRLRGHVVGGDH